MPDKNPQRPTKATGKATGKTTPTPPRKGRARTPEAREAAALALATGSTVRDSAHRAGVDETTLRRWRNDPEFIARVGEFRQEITEQTIHLEAAYRVAALDRAAQALPNPDDRIGVRAADVLLRNTARPPQVTAGDDVDGTLLTYLRSLGA